MANMAGPLWQEAANAVRPLSRTMRTSRRSFIRASLALPLLGREHLGFERVNGADSSFDPWVEIHAENLRHNVGEIHRRVESRPVLAVIKNNGYGMGVANVARLRERFSDIAGFAVVKLQGVKLGKKARARKT